MVECCLICVLENVSPIGVSGVRICGHPDYICANCKTDGWISRKGWGGDYSIVNNHKTGQRFIHPDEVANRLYRTDKSKLSEETLKNLQNYKNLSLSNKIQLTETICKLEEDIQEPLF